MCGDLAHLATFLPVRHVRFFRRLFIQKNLVCSYPLDILDRFRSSGISMRKSAIIFFLVQKGQDLHHVLPAVGAFLFPESQYAGILHMPQPHVIGGQCKEGPVRHEDRTWDPLLHDREVSSPSIDAFSGVEPIPNPEGCCRASGQHHDASDTRWASGSPVPMGLLVGLRCEKFPGQVIFLCGVPEVFLIARKPRFEMFEKYFSVIACEYFSDLHGCGGLRAGQVLHVLCVKVGFDGRKMIGCLFRKLRKHEVYAYKHTNQKETRNPFQKNAHWLSSSNHSLFLLPSGNVEKKPPAFAKATADKPSAFHACRAYFAEVSYEG